MKLSRQQDKILRALEAAGREGCTSRDLNVICYRYGGRIMELRGKGIGIETERISAGLFLYRLTGGAPGAAGVAGTERQHQPNGPIGASLASESLAPQTDELIPRAPGYGVP